MTISYTRTFSHTDWVDNVSRVQAGGDDGFNGQFQRHRGEFDTISGVVEPGRTARWPSSRLS